MSGLDVLGQDLMALGGDDATAGIHFHSSTHIAACRAVTNDAIDGRSRVGGCASLGGRLGQKAAPRAGATRSVV